MKSMFSLLLLLALLAACKQLTQTESGNGTNNTDNATGANQQPKEILTINGKQYKLYAISEEEFDKAINTQPFANADRRVIMQEDGIQIKTNAKIVELKNDTTMGESMVTYSFGHLITDPPYAHIEAAHWEWSTDLFVNLKTGEVTELWANPILSPDRQHLIAYSFDLEAQFMPNGLQLFRINEKGIYKIWEHELEDWGPEVVKWDTDSSIVIQKATPNENHEFIHDYVRLVLFE